MKTFLIISIQLCLIYAFIEENTLRELQGADHWNIFRIALSHTGDECFYIDAKVNDTVHVIYQVLRGGDSHIQAIITDPTNTAVFSQDKYGFGWYSEEQLKISGTFRFCLRNEQYFTTKIIYIGVLAAHSTVIEEANVEAVQLKRDNQTLVINEFSTIAMNKITSVIRAIYQITAYQTIQRVHHTHHLYAVEDNGKYVQLWAITQIIIMIVCSVLQVFTIRHLFKSYNPKRTSNSIRFVLDSR